MFSCDLFGISRGFRYYAKRQNKINNWEKEEEVAKCLRIFEMDFNFFLL